MSIQSEITRLSGNVSSALTAIRNKGVVIPQDANSDDLATLIAQIPSGTGTAINITDTTDPVSGGTIRSISGITLTGDTVSPASLLSGYTAHNALGESITGTLTTAPTLKFGVLRPDSELVKKFTYDKYIVADEEKTWPGYTTTATTLLASSALSETYTMDYSTYNYYILERMLAYPTYSISTHGKGRCEYNIASYLYEIAEVEPSSFITIDGNAKAYTSRTVSIPSSAFYREFYWSSASAVSVQSTTAYGVYFTVAAPTVNSGVITFNAPAFGTRGHTTYFTSTYMNKVTDVRYQWVIELYRSPKGNYNMDGWGSTTQAKHIIDCVNNNNLKLT